MTKYQDYDVMTFEEAMKELEKIVSGLDSGDRALEDAIEMYQRGVYLSALCAERLDEIEKRVKILTNPEVSDAEKDFLTDAPAEMGE